MEAASKNRALYIALGISLIVNLVLIGIILCKNDGDGKQDGQEEEASMAMEQLTEKAKAKVKEYVCSNLYIPESYDPVEIRVDSAFWSYITDYECLKAAEELIDLRRDYHNAKFSYDEAVNNIRTFGGSGVFRHHTVERDNAKKTMDETKPKIEKCEAIIRNRDTSHDGTFVGWFVYNRYRAKTNSNNVVFNEVLLLYDKDLEHWNVSYIIDKTKEANLEKLRQIMDEVLGISN